jgi:hypothetical protein
MQINDLPINKTIKYIDEEHTSVLLTRIEDQKMIGQYINKSNGDEVAKMYFWANGDSALVSFDQTYWSFSINGNLATSIDVSDLVNRKLKSADISVKDRTMKFTI